jgi:uncharacterized protein involved in exopolysaccharide biosynthesis
LRGGKARADIYGVESAATFLAGQQADYENRIVELAAYRTRSENTKVRSASVLPTEPVGPQRRLMVMLAAMGGLVGFTMVAFMVDNVRTARQRRLFGGQLFER